MASEFPREIRESWEVDPYFLFWDELRYSTAYRVEFQDMHHRGRARPFGTPHHCVAPRRERLDRYRTSLNSELVFLDIA